MEAELVVGEGLAELLQVIDLEFLGEEVFVGAVGRLGFVIGPMVDNKTFQFTNVDVIVVDNVGEGRILGNEGVGQDEVIVVDGA
jgi:hypothetical protein